MQRRRIGALDVSVVGLGCNNLGPRLDAARTADVVHAPLDAGVNFFDAADLNGEGWWDLSRDELAEVDTLMSVDHV